MKRYIAFKQVDRLVAIATLSAVGLTWLLLVSLDAITAFMSQINDIGQGQYTLTRAVIYILLTIPRRCYELFGNAALIGGLLGLGALAASGELTALRAAGLSKLRICASVALALAMLTALVTFIGETLGPLGEQKAQALSIAAKAKEVALGKGGSLWARDGETVINAKRGHTREAAEGSTGGTVVLEDVRVFEFSADGHLSSLALAKTATHTQGEWSMQDVRRTQFGESSVTSTEEKTTHWVSGLDPHVLALSIIHPQYLSARDLARNIDYMRRNKQDASSFEQAYWGRVFYPINVLVLAFLAMPFAFGALRTGGLGKRLFLGMMLAVSFYFAQHAIVSMGAVYNANMIVVNALPALLLMMAGVMYFRRYA